MNKPKDPANAAHSAARRQNAALQGHDDARDAIKDLCDRRAKGEPPAQLRARNSTFGCQTMRRLAPDHQHRLKDEAYCRELMALTTYKLMGIVQDLDTHNRKHTGERPHKCTWPGCSYAVARQWSLASHIARRHGTNS